MWIRVFRCLVSIPFYSLAVTLVLVIRADERQGMLIKGGYAQSEHLGIVGLIVGLCGLGMLSYVPSFFVGKTKRWYACAKILSFGGFFVFAYSYVHFMFH